MTMTNVGPSHAVASHIYWTSDKTQPRDLRESAGPAAFYLLSGFLNKADESVYLVDIHFLRLEIGDKVGMLGYLCFRKVCVDLK